MTALASRSNRTSTRHFVRCRNTYARAEYLDLVQEAFGARPRLAHALGRADNAGLRARIDRWSTSRIDFVRQYVRLLHSLVLFAENELAPGAA